MSDTAPVVAHAGMPPPVVPLPVALRLLSKAVDWTVVAMGAIMIALIFANVVLHAFGKDLAWVTELGEFMMVWVTFLGGVCAAQRGAHMSINEFLDKLPPGRRRLAAPYQRWREGRLRSGDDQEMAARIRASVF